MTQELIAKAVNDIDEAFKSLNEQRVISHKLLIACLTGNSEASTIAWQDSMNIEMKIETIYDMCLVNLHNCCSKPEDE